MDKERVRRNHPIRNDKSEQQVQTEKAAHIFEGRRQELRSGLIEYIDQKGRVSLTDLTRNVLPRTMLGDNDFIILLEEMCNDAEIMVVSVTSDGPQYQIFSYALTPVKVDHSRYLSHRKA